MATEPTDFNQAIIEEFRSNGGKVGGMFAGAPMLLLHHKGAKSGTRRVNPLMYQPLKGAYAIFASAGGAPKNPDWYHNVKANPDTTVEVGGDSVPVKVRVAHGTERDEIYEAQKKAYPQFAQYEQATTRKIPVLVLEPAG